MKAAMKRGFPLNQPSTTTQFSKPPTKWSAFSRGDSRTHPGPLLPSEMEFPAKLLPWRGGCTTLNSQWIAALTKSKNSIGSAEKSDRPSGRPSSIEFRKSTAASRLNSRETCLPIEGSTKKYKGFPGKPSQVESKT